MPMLSYNADDATVDRADGASQAGSKDGQSRDDNDTYQQVVLLYNGHASQAIAEGDTVVFDFTTSGFVAAKWLTIAPATADTPIIGVALEAIAVAKWGAVVIKGYCPKLKSGTVSARDPLQQSATAGQAEAAGASTQNRFGHALTADGTPAAGFCRAWLGAC